MKNKKYEIGTPGQVGFGIAAIKNKYLPKGFKKLDGHKDINSDNYGNIIDANNSIMVWIPKFYFKWTKNNKCKISSQAKDGYVLHRAFLDGGKTAKGIFVDKYECGNINGIFTSKEDITPCGTYGENSISKLNNNPDSNYAGLYTAVKTRGKAYNLTTIFTYNALGMLMYANNGNKLEQMKYHNNQKCGVRWIDPIRYEVVSGFIKLNSNGGVFKVLDPKIAAKNIYNDTDAYNEKYYKDIDLSDVINNDGWAYLDDKTTTFKMGEKSTDTDNIKTCMGIPNKNALSDKPNNKYSNAGIYRYLRNGVACLVGGNWSYSSNAGSFTMDLYDSWTDSSYSVGGRACVVLCSER